MNPTLTFGRSTCFTKPDSKKNDAPGGRGKATVWDVVVREGRPPLACLKIQEPPVIGRLADKTAGTMPSDGHAAIVREASDLVGEIGEDVPRRRNHIRMAVITPARLRASAAKEAGNYATCNPELSDAKDLTPTTNSPTAVRI